MIDKLNAYSIDFKGLGLGEHTFEFVLDEAFFAEYPEGEITQGNLKAQVLLRKQNNLMEIECGIEGTVQVVCDRCLEQFALPIAYSGQLFVRTGTPQADADTDVIYIGEHDFRLHLAQYLYESVVLSLPIQRYHGQSGTNPNDCDADMLGRMNQDGQQQGEPEIDDPRWAKLKELIE